MTAFPNYAPAPPAPSISQNLQTKTPALHRALDGLEVGMSSQPGAFDLFCEVFDTCLLATHPLALGTVLNFFSESQTLACIRRWSEHNPDAKALSKLSEAIVALPPQLTPPPLANSKAGREHFFGGLNECYLLALLVERTPTAAHDPNAWIPALRTWLFLHAFTRHRDGVRLDENIQTVARAMRLGCDTDAAWLQLFLDLYQAPAPKNFRELNFRLGTRARQLLSTPERADKERKALRALSEISLYRNKPLKNATTPPPLIGKLQRNTPKLTSEIAPPETLGEDHDASLAFNGEDGTILVTETPPEGYTPAARKLSARTVLLASAEISQLLPWSWQRPNPYETELLSNWVRNTLSTAPSASADALAAALIWTATALGRSATRALALQIGSTVEAEWQFDTKDRVFKRQPPMRRPGWLPDEPSTRWVEPIADAITIHPPESIQQALGKAHQRNKDASTLRELWPSGDSKTPEQAITAILREISPRLTGGMLAEMLPQRAFELHKDAVLARLIASHPQSPLSGAHSYAQWRLDTVTNLLSGNVSPAATTPAPRSVALGSRLAVLDDPVRDAIRQSRKAVQTARESENPIAIHNTYTAYVVLAMLASTGGRPIRSPFESLAHFDFDAELLFIDDKHSSNQQHCGRVIPMVSGFGAFLQKRYLPHLRNLAEVFAETNPDLSRNINNTASTSSTGELPLFFFLEDNGTWAEVSPASLFQHAELDCPLPANLFRHRLANRLRTQGLDPEIIDGLLGHGEWGSETWSLLSFRTWQDDAAKARPRLDQAFRPLRFFPLRGLANTSSYPCNPDPKSSCAPGRSHFGSAARHQERRRRHLSTLRDAEFTIREFLQEKELATLNAEELDKLADQLTRTQDGMPISSGGLRLAYLIRKLERLEGRLGKRLRPRKERLLAENPPSIFTEHAPGAQKFVIEKMRALEQIKPRTQSTQRLVAVTRLCLESRITDTALLMDVAAGKSYRLIGLEQRYYIEYGKLDNEIAGRRFRISNQTAEYLHQSRTARPLKTTDTFPPSLRSVLGDTPETPLTIGEAIAKLAQIVEQANALSLPGIVCGVLSGKIESTALGWRDIVRLRSGRKIDIELPNEGLETDARLTFHGQLTKTNNVTQRNNANKKLLQDVPLIIRSAESTASGASNVRRSMCAKLEKAIREGVQQAASPSLLHLAQWILHLARPERRGALRAISLRRYWSALAWRFDVELSEFDPLQADEDEITEAYTRVLLSSEKLASTYTLERLAQFHHWLARTFDIENPAWEELPLTLPGLGVSPGFIMPQEYQEAFQNLLHSQIPDSETSLSAAITLLLAYRFGLRRREALCLTREDWETIDESIVITVRGNRWRHLKSDASRRQVPLVFPLTPFEKAAIARVLALYGACHGEDHRHLLLSYSTEAHAISTIQQSLKQATGNPRMTLHHARHSVANLVALAAMGIRPTPWNWPNMPQDADTQLLGGKSPASRRHSWAISRFLGHASPSTSCKSYLHFVFEWAESLLSIQEGANNSIKLSGIHCLDELPELPTQAIDSAKLNQPTQPATIQSVLKAYRLHARKISTTAIAATLAHSEDEIQSWLSLLEDGVGITRAGQIVNSFSEHTWDRLISWAASLKPLSIACGTPVSSNALLGMIGEKRQLLGWLPEHFALLRSALAYLNIKETQYKIFGSAQLHAGTRELALANDFKIVERPFIGGKQGTENAKRRMQIDTAFTGPHREPVSSRIALQYQENDTHAIRNQPQLALIFLIFCISQTPLITETGSTRSLTPLPPPSAED